MARSNLNPVDGTENLTDTDTGRDQGAWLAASEAMKFRVYNGEVLGGQADCLYTVPAPTDFDMVPEGLQGFLAYSIMKHVEYRVAQNAGGDLNEAAAKFISELPSFKPVRSMDAAEGAFLSTVTNSVINRVVDADGNVPEKAPNVVGTWVVPTKDADGRTVLQLCTKGTTGAITLQSAIDSTADRQRDRSFDTVVQRALERGRNKPSKDTEGKAPRARRASADLGDLGADLE